LNTEQLNLLMDAVSAYGELMGGLRKQFIAQGFSEEIAELMALEVLKKAT
jgi:hypothetical protein